MSRSLGSTYIGPEHVLLAIAANDDSALRTRTPSTDRRGLEQRLEQLDRDKDQAVADEQYEKATELRDQIAEVRSRLGSADGSENQVPEAGVTDIADVVSRATGIPVAQLTEAERDRLLRLEDELHRRVVGQDEAVRAVAEAIRRSRAGIGDEDRPCRQLPVPGPDRRRQDRARQGAGGGAVR